MQTDCQLVLYNSSYAAVYESNTLVSNARPGCYAAFNGSCMLIVYKPDAAGGPSTAEASYGQNGNFASCSVEVTPDGNLTVTQVDPNGYIISTVYPEGIPPSSGTFVRT